jgi:hypothetical protein
VEITTNRTAAAQRLRTLSAPFGVSAGVSAWRTSVPSVDPQPARRHMSAPTFVLNYNSIVSTSDVADAKPTGDVYGAAKQAPPRGVPR